VVRGLVKGEIAFKQKIQYFPASFPIPSSLYTFTKTGYDIIDVVLSMFLYFLSLAEVSVMSWSWAALMPHPPIIVPDVGRGREDEAAVTTNGVKAVMERIKEVPAPDRLLLISPHQPYSIGAFSINRARVIRGSFAPFGAPSLVFDLRTPITEVDSISSYLETRDIQVCFNESHDLTHDQGSLVPLYFLEEHCNGLPLSILASPIGLSAGAAYELGRALAAFDDGLRWGLLASGDLSHRLKPGAPAGFSPEGEKFDRAVVEALKNSDVSILNDLPRKTLEDAGECGLRSVMVMLGLCANSGPIDVVSYEGPFGVGYCNAVWVNE
jgi:aromatic ring-opening dioxygenase LigB subunit